MTRSKRCLDPAWSIALIGSMLGSINPVGAQPPTLNGKIAFESERDGNFDVYVMNADGSGQTRLTDNTASDFDPSWSPDGTKIAFETVRDGNFELFVMNADGSRQTRLTDNSAGDYEPEWGSAPPSPETQITSRPRARTTDRTPTFKFKATESGATFECKLDAGPFQPCVPPKKYGKQSLGKHTFRVRATSPGGTDPTPAKATWKVIKP